MIYEATWSLAAFPVWGFGLHIAQFVAVCFYKILTSNLQCLHLSDRGWQTKLRPKLEDATHTDRQTDW